MRLTTSISEKRYVALITDADRHTETDPLPKQFDALVGALAFPCCCHCLPASLYANGV